MTTTPLRYPDRGELNEKAPSFLSKQNYDKVKINRKIVENIKDKGGYASEVEPIVASVQEYYQSIQRNFQNLHPQFLQSGDHQGVIYPDTMFQFIHGSLARLVYPGSSMDLRFNGPDLDAATYRSGVSMAYRLLSELFRPSIDPERTRSTLNTLQMINTMMRRVVQESGRAGSTRRHYFA